MRKKSRLGLQVINMWKKILASVGILGCISLALAQMPVKPVDGYGNEQMLGAPGRRVIYALQAVPNSSTAIVSSSIKVVTLFCNNATAGAVTLTITDNQGSPVTYYPGVSIAANSVNMLVAQSGLSFTDGIKWSASASNSIYCQIEGVQ